MRICWLICRIVMHQAGRIAAGILAQLQEGELRPRDGEQ